MEGGLRSRMRARSVQLKSVRAINNIGAFAQAGKTKRRTDSGDKRRIKKIQPAAATPIEADLSLPLSLAPSTCHKHNACDVLTRSEKHANNLMNGPTNS